MIEALVQEQLRGHEGDVDTVYDDATGKRLQPGDCLQGVPTIGVGFNLFEPLPREVSDYWLRYKVRESVREAQKLPVYHRLGTYQKAAIVNMVYNMGLPRLQGFENMLKALEDGDREAVFREALDSKWARTVGDQPGQRAYRLALMLRDDKPY